MSEPFDAVDIIATKRDGGVLDTAMINWWIDAYMRGKVNDEQMAAWTMAVYLRGMNDSEILALTNAMIASGDRMDFGAQLQKPTADKHSTGGVGDKITLPLMPIVAAFGVAVPQLSGRGLGHTGGTLDKLESIPGWRANLSNDEILRQLQDVGGVVCAAGSGLAPADKRIYALRDEIATVGSIPLIASSIMSKKIAEGTGSLVLDVKFGAGAFMRELDDARHLAETMVRVGQGAGVNTRALLTSMDAPLGYAIGNANEVAEALDVLRGEGPADVVELTYALAREMLSQAGLPDADPDSVVQSGAAMDVWRAAVSAQGGDPDAPLPQPAHRHEVTAQSDGFITRQDALQFGIAAWRLGAGRAQASDPVALAAGIDLAAKVGDEVSAGDPLFTLLTDDASTIPRALDALDDAVDIGPRAPERRSLIAEVVTA